MKKFRNQERASRLLKELAVATDRVLAVNERVLEATRRQAAALHAGDVATFLYESLISGAAGREADVEQAKAEAIADVIRLEEPEFVERTSHEAMYRHAYDMMAGWDVDKLDVARDQHEEECDSETCPVTVAIRDRLFEAASN